MRTLAILKRINISSLFYPGVVILSDILLCHVLMKPVAGKISVCVFLFSLGNITVPAVFAVRNIVLPRTQHKWKMKQRVEQVYMHNTYFRVQKRQQNSVEMSRTADLYIFHLTFEQENTKDTVGHFYTLVNAAFVYIFLMLLYICNK